MHGRARKVPLEKPSPRDEIADAFPPDDAVVLEMPSFVEEPRESGRICLGCGGDGSRHEGCAHAEIARLHEPSRAAGEVLARLRRAAAEHRAASRALRALVTSELARGRAELETATPIAPEPIAPAKAPDEDSLSSTPAPLPPSNDPAPCPRCLEREAEAPPAPVNAPRVTRKKSRAPVDEQTLLFASEAPPSDERG